MNKLISRGAAAVATLGAMVSANAAVDAAITTAITDAKTDGTTVAVALTVLGAAVWGALYLKRKFFG